MRPLSFENLRRLVGRRKDRNEPSFKRSESFKRISIRKSYLDRGKRRNKLQKSLEPAIGPAATSSPSDKVSPRQIKEQEVRKYQSQKDGSLGHDSISYDEWLQGVGSSSREKLHEDHRDHQTRSSAKFELRQTGRKADQKVAKSRINESQRQSEADLVADDLEVLELGAFPVSSAKPFRVSGESVQDEKTVCGQSVLQDPCGPVEGPPSVSISLGRVWRDAVPVPYPSSSGPSVHHSLDSALKERKPQPTVARTVSAPEKSVSGKEGSSSPFGFSLRIARLADFRAGGTRNGFFRRKAPKPAPSVSAEGYFKRTSTSRRSSTRRRGKKACQKSRRAQDTRNSSPVWFVPPEKRRSRRQRRVWREIRYLPEEEEEDDDDRTVRGLDEWSSNLSDDQFDDQKLLLSGDFNERPEEPPTGSLMSSCLGSFSAASSSSSCRPAPKISDFNEDKLFSEELRTSGLLARRTTWRPSCPTDGNYFASSQFLSFLSKGSAGRAGREKSRSDAAAACHRCLSSSDSDSGNEPGRAEHERRKGAHAAQRQHAKRQRSGLRRRPLRRKSQLRRASGQPVYLVRKCSSLRKRPSKSSRDVVSRSRAARRLATRFSASSPPGRKSSFSITAAVYSAIR